MRVQFQPQRGPSARGQGVTAWRDRAAPVAALGMLLALSAALSPPAGSSPAVSDDDATFFVEEVLPVLTESCFECHGPQRTRGKGGLRIHSRESLLSGGYSGPAVDLEQPAESLLLQAVRYDDPDFQMPPDGRLGDAEIGVLEEWVRRGMPWVDAALDPDSMPDEVADPMDPAVGRQWWAFRPVVRPELPAAPEPGGGANPIDALVDARLRAEGLEAAPAAQRRELARRATFDLLGVPPTAEELARFTSDTAPDAWERFVDGLLARPEYGERWARRWLDLVRFAQTAGYERDEEKPQVWRYRDYVVDAFNADKPFDRFVLEQLAGDELEDGGREGLIATTFYRLGAWDDEPDDPRQAVFDELDDSLRAISEGFLGVTIGCARCHDHKFDPFPQEDYYRMLAFLRGIRPYQKPRFKPDGTSPRLLDDSPAGIAQLEAERARHIADLTAQKDAYIERGRARALQELGPDDVPQTDGELANFLPELERREWFLLTLNIKDAQESFMGEVPWVLCVDEVPPEEVPATHLLIRGQATSPGPQVEPRFPAAMCADDASARPTLAAQDASSGRRLALARWIASPENPLTARVIVNRVWQAHFGRGLSGTPNDFGAQGERPSHPELLDWLAAEFVADGWSLKRLQRRILLSNTYRRSSRIDPARDARALEVDPENLLLWRQRSRRLEGEVIRDSILAVSGQLVSGSGGRGYFPALQRGALAGGSRPGGGWEPVDRSECDRRSLYAYAKRTLPVPLLQAFDGPGSASLPVGRRTTTFVSSQALMLLNGELAGRAAVALAERVAAEGGGLDEWVPRAFRQVLAREPSDEELRLLLEYAHAQRAAFAELPSDRLEFRPLLPARVDYFFLEQLDADAMLSGPRAGWTRLRGRWGNFYNATLESDPGRGPAALYEAGLEDGRVSVRMRLANGTQTGSVYLRAHADGDALGGLELRLDAQHGTLEVLRHDSERIESLALEQLGVAVETWYTVAAALNGTRLRVWLDTEHARLVDVEIPPADGHAGLGVRVSGEALELESLTLQRGDEVQVLSEDDPGSPDQQTLEAVCLSLFNLNEFVFLD